METKTKLPLVLAAINGNLPLFKDILEYYPCINKTVYIELDDFKLDSYLDELGRLVSDKLRRSIITDKPSVFSSMFIPDTIPRPYSTNEFDNTDTKITKNLLDQLISDIKNDNTSNFTSFFKLVEYCNEDLIIEEITSLGQLAIVNDRNDIFHEIQSFSDNHITRSISEELDTTWFQYALDNKKTTILIYYIENREFDPTEELLNVIIDTKNVNLISSVISCSGLKTSHLQQLIDTRLEDHQIIEIIDRSKCNGFGDAITFISINRHDLLRQVINVSPIGSIEAYTRLQTKIDITKYLDNTHYQLLVISAYNVLIGNLTTILIPSICKEDDELYRLKVIETNHHCENIIDKYAEYLIQYDISIMFSQLIKYGKLHLAKRVNDTSLGISLSAINKVFTIPSVNFRAPLLSVARAYDIDTKILDSIEIVEYLLSLGATVTHDMFTKAIQINNLDVVKLLFKQEIIQKLKDYNNEFVIAIDNGNETIAAMLYFTNKVNIKSIELKVVDRVCLKRDGNMITFLKFLGVDLELYITNSITTSMSLALAEFIIKFVSTKTVVKVIRFITSHLNEGHFTYPMFAQEIQDIFRKRLVELLK